MKSTWVSGLKRTAIAGASLAAITAAGAAQAVDVLNEGFDNVAALPGAGWVIINDSSPVGITTWDQGVPDIFEAFAGAPSAYVAADFFSAAPGGTISNWLISPELTFTGPATWDFVVRVAGQDFLDTVQFYYSSAGASSDIGDFNLLGSYSSDVDEGWIPVSLLLGGAGANSGRFAFRYFANDTNVDGNYVGIDSVLVSTSDIGPVPEPSTYAMLLGGLGLLAFMARRRRA